MDDDHFDRLQRLFLEACEVEPAVVESWLDEEIPDDPELANELRELIAHHHRSQSPLDRPASERDATDRTELYQDLPAPSLATKLSIPGYRIEQEVARGGQSVVFQGVQEATGQTVAIKVLLNREFCTAEDRERQDREVKILGRISHPNIVGVVDRGRTESGVDYVVMPFVRGRSLDDHLLYLRQESAEPDDKGGLLKLFVKIARAVGVAHQAGVIHRDLKPLNIRIDEHGEPRILDFGLARDDSDQQGSQSVTAPHLTVQGKFLGSLPWASPEQARGDLDQIGPTTDVYSLGVVLYQMLTAGRFPYGVVGAIHEVLQNILNAQPQPPSRVNRPPGFWKSARWGEPGPTRLNAAIDAVVLKALEKRPEDRYANGAEFAEDVERYLRGEPTKAVPRLRLARYRPKRLRWAGAAVAVGVLLMSQVYSGLQNRKAALAMADAQRMAAEIDEANQRLDESNQQLAEKTEAAIRKAQEAEKALAMEAKNAIESRRMAELARRELEVTRKAASDDEPATQPAEVEPAEPSPDPSRIDDLFGSSPAGSETDATPEPDRLEGLRFAQNPGGRGLGELGGRGTTPEQERAKLPQPAFDAPDPLSAEWDVQVDFYTKAYRIDDDGRVEINGAPVWEVQNRYVGRSGDRTVIDERLTIVLKDKAAGFWPVIVKLSIPAAEALNDSLKSAISGVARSGSGDEPPTTVALSIKPYEIGSYGRVALPDGTDLLAQPSGEERGLDDPTDDPRVALVMKDPSTGFQAFVARMPRKVAQGLRGDLSKVLRMKKASMRERVMLRTSDGHYVGARGGGGREVNAVGRRAGTSEVFLVEWQDKQRTRGTLRTRDGSYVHAVRGGGAGIDAERDEPGSSEVFEFVWRDTDRASAHLITRSGALVRADQGGNVDATATEATDQTLFAVVYAR